MVLDAGLSTADLALSLVQRARSHGAAVVHVSPLAESTEGGLAVGPLDSPLAEELFPLLASRVQNQLIHRLAAQRGHEAGIFRHGGKVTSHE